MKSFQINLSTIIVGIALVLVIYFGYKYYSGRIESITTELDTQVKLKNALVDEMTVVKNKRDELESTKLTLQGTIKQITDEKNNLTDKQKELFARIKEQDKNLQIITIALVDTRTELENLKNDMGTFDDNDTLSFPYDDKKDLMYSIKVTNVKPADSTKKSDLIIKKLVMNNTQVPKFTWDKSKRNNYPISFTMSNSNKYISTTNIESYAIPEVNQEIKPTKWQKFKSWTGKTGGKIGTLGVGVAIGYLLFQVL